MRRTNTSNITDKEAAEKLTAKRQYTSLLAVDGHEVCSSRKILNGLSHFSSYKNPQEANKIAQLNLSCALGCYDALVERSAINCRIIKNDETSHDAKQKAQEQLLKDLDRLASLYWSVGCIHASRVLVDIGNYYSRKQPANGEENPYGVETEGFWQRAACFFYRAKLLLNYTQSQDLVGIFYPNGIYYQNEANPGTGFTSEQDAENTILADHFDAAQKAKLNAEETKHVADMISHNQRLK